ncbi:MAG: hypothetical protein ACXADY_21210 [Candidatus Hodarchaeales archaeon]
MLVLQKIILYLEQVRESTILEMTKVANELDRNRLSGFLRACEEVGIIESIGKASHRKYRLTDSYLKKLEALSIQQSHVERQHRKAEKNGIIRIKSVLKNVIFLGAMKYQRG